MPAQRSYGMKVTGPFLDVENPNKFVFLRSFPSLEERERMKDAFYDGELWRNELEKLAMPLLDSYDVTLCEAQSDRDAALLLPPDPSTPQHFFDLMRTCKQESRPETLFQNQKTHSLRNPVRASILRPRNRTQYAW